MDLLLFPSRYEGFGLVAIEGQVRGLHVLASTNVPIETQISDGIKFLPLDAGIHAWAATALAQVGKVQVQTECLSTYEIVEQGKKLENFYERVQDTYTRARY